MTEVMEHHRGKILIAWIICWNMTWLAGCRETGMNDRAASGESQQPVPVQVIEARERMLSVPVHATARLEAKEQIKLSFKTGGIIRQITAEEGMTVKEGQLLASLDLSEIEARVNEAELAYRKALRDYRRVENLYRDSVATLEQLEHVRTVRDMAYNNLRIARFNLRHSVIRAPSPGKILKKLAEEGEMIAPGMPVILFASTDKAWVVRCHVPDKEIIRIRPGDSAVVTFDVWKGRSFPGIVAMTGAVADPYSGTFEAEVVLDPSGIPLFSGLIGTVKIYPSSLVSGVVLPYRALKQGNRMHGEVWMVQNGRALLREIGIRQMLDTVLLIGQGVMPGDTVVIEGMEDLTPGVEVKAVNTF